MDREPQARTKHAAVAWNGQMLVWGGDGGSTTREQIDASSVSIIDVSKGTWQPPRQLKGDALPDGFSRMAVAWDEEKAYTFAGAIKSKKLINDIFVVDVSSFICQKIRQARHSAPPPSVRNYNAMVYWKRRLINYGGFVGDTSSSDLHVFDLDKNMWTLQTTTGDKPLSMGGHTLTVIGNHRALLFGGTIKGLARNTTYSLEMETWEWREVKIDGKKPPPRYHHAACAIDSPVKGQISQMMVFGGKNDKPALSDMWLLDMANGSWSMVSLPTEMTGRWGHSAIVFDAGSDFRIIVLFGDFCRRAIADTIFLLLSWKEGSWVLDKVVNQAQLKSKDNELQKILKRVETGELCVVGKVEEVVVRPEEPFTLSPVGHGATLTVPAGAVQSASDTPATVSLKTCLPTPSFTFPEGYIPISAVYGVLAPSNFKESVQLKFEHFAKIDDGAKDVVVFNATSSLNVRNGKKEYIFQPIEKGDGDIVVGKDHCTVSTHLSGFVGAGVLQKSETMIPKRYAVLCSYTDEVQGVGHAAIAVTVDDAVYMTNFREAVQQEWGKSVSLSHRCIHNVSFTKQDAYVEYPQTPSGWNIVSSSSNCNISQEDVDVSKLSAASPYDYPPRVFFEMTPTENAEPCTLQLRLSGLSRDVDFQISLRLVHGAKNKPGKVKDGVEIEKPTLITLWSLSTQKGEQIRVIEESANYYRRIGIILLNDRNGNRVDTIENDERGKGENIIRQIYKFWMREDVNCSWTTLAECFRGCGLQCLAQNIEQHFGLPSPPLPPPSVTTPEGCCNCCVLI